MSQRCTAWAPPLASTVMRVSERPVGAFPKPIPDAKQLAKDMEARSADAAAQPEEERAAH